MSLPRRLLLLGAVVLLGAGAGVASAASDPGAPAAGPRLFSPADAASFRRLQSRLGGTSGVAVSTVGRGRSVQRLGSLSTGIAWSTSKVPVAMAVIAAGEADERASDLRLAITASDNAAAERLWSALGAGRPAARAATRQLRAAGDRNTEVSSERLRSGFTAFGQTTWTLADQARFAAALPCLPAGRQVLRLMGQTIGAQRWGLGQVGGDAQLKGGWGPGSRPGVDGPVLDRQLGIVTIKGRATAVAIASRPADGSHASGTRNLTAIAKWMAGHVDVRAVAAAPVC
jgi:hypothetical protein